jgi:hypothetical protein
VWISFSRHYSPNWRVIEYFTRQFRKQLAKNIERVSERAKKNLARLASGFVFLLANPEIYSHLASG